MFGEVYGSTGRRGGDLQWTRIILSTTGTQMLGVWMKVFEECARQQQEYLSLEHLGLRSCDMTRGLSSQTETDKSRKICLDV